MRDFLEIMKGHNYFNERRWNKTNSTYEFETGSIIEFFSVKEDEKKARGGRRDRLFVNEANRIPFDTFEQMEVRTRDLIYLDWNPSEEFWYYTDVKDRRNDSEEITLTYKDNEALDENTIKSIEQRKDRRQWWLVYGLGQLGEVEGRIYKGWKQIEEIPFEARIVRRGLNFGYAADQCGLAAIYKWNDAFILDEEIYSLGIHNRTIAEIIQNLDEPQTLVIADCAEPKSIDEIKTYSINIIGCKKGKNLLNQGIDFVQEQKIYVTKRSINIWREYNNYLWERGKDGKIIKHPQRGFHYIMDGIRYGFDRYKPKVVSNYQQPAYEGLSEFEYKSPSERPLAPRIDMGMNPDGDLDIKHSF